MRKREYPSGARPPDAIFLKAAKQDSRAAEIVQNSAAITEEAIRAALIFIRLIGSSRAYTLEAPQRYGHVGDQMFFHDTYWPMIGEQAMLNRAELLSAFGIE